MGTQLSTSDTSLVGSSEEEVNKTEPTFDESFSDDFAKGNDKSDAEFDESFSDDFAIGNDKPGTASDENSDSSQEDLD